MQELSLDEISDRIADAILEESFINKNTITERVRPILNIWSKKVSKPNKHRRTASVQKLQWTVAKNINEKRFWCQKLREEIGEENMKPLYDECQNKQTELGYHEFKEE